MSTYYYILHFSQYDTWYVLICRILWSTHAVVTLYIFGTEQQKHIVQSKPTLISQSFFSTNYPFCRQATFNTPWQCNIQLFSIDSGDSPYLSIQFRSIYHRSKLHRLPHKPTTMRCLTNSQQDMICRIKDHISETTCSLMTNIQPSLRWLHLWKKELKRKKN